MTELQRFAVSLLPNTNEPPTDGGMPRPNVPQCCKLQVYGICFMQFFHLPFVLFVCFLAQLLFLLIFRVPQL